MIVLKVISRTIETMNGQKFQKYRLRLKLEDSIFETDGFTFDLEKCIQPGDIIENMQVVGRVSGAELCKIYYETRARETEDKNIVQEKPKEIVKKRGIVYENEQLSLYDK